MQTAFSLHASKRLVVRRGAHTTLLGYFCLHGCRAGCLASQCKDLGRAALGKCALVCSWAPWERNLASACCLGHCSAVNHRFLVSCLVLHEIYFVWSLALLPSRRHKTLFAAKNEGSFELHSIFWLFFSLSKAEMLTVLASKKSAIIKNINLPFSPHPLQSTKSKIQLSVFLRTWVMWHAQRTRTSVSGSVMWTGNVHFYCTLRKEISLDSCDLKPIIFPVQKKENQNPKQPGFKTCSIYL